MENNEVIIELKDIRKTYDLGGEIVHALNGVSLTIHRGEFVAIMGASGSGKSTMMNMLGCLDKPTSGDYIFEGEHIANLTKDQYADFRNRKIGFVFQGFNLLPRTSAIDNVIVPLYYNRGGSKKKSEFYAKARVLLEKVGLGKRMNHVPSKLSGGQQQRVAIARALVNDPQIIFADEPTGNLDTKTSIEVMALFQELNDSGITIILVTHEPDIAEYCTRIVVMRDGNIIEDKPVENRRVAKDEIK